MKNILMTISALLLAVPMSVNAEEMFVEVDEGTDLKEILKVINAQPMPQEQVEVIEWISVPAADNTAAAADDDEIKPALKPFKPINNVFDLANRNHGQVKRIYRESTQKIDLKKEIEEEMLAEAQAVADELAIADEKYEFIER